MFKPFSKFDFLACGMKRHLSIPEATSLLAQYKMKVTASESPEDYLEHHRVLKAGLTDEVLYGELAFCCDEYCIEDTGTGTYLKPELCFVETDYLIDYVGSIKKFGVNSEELKSLAYGLDEIGSPQPACSENEAGANGGDQAAVAAPDVTAFDLEHRIADLIDSEVTRKLERTTTKWTPRLLVIEDAIKHMGEMLRMDCRCSHDILAEISYVVGTDRNQEKFSVIDAKPENAGYKLQGYIRKLARKLVPEERVFGLEGKHKPEKCNCEISDHRKMTKVIRQHRKESSSDP